MNKCSLCGRSVANDNSEFGLSCLKRVGLFVNMKDIKNYSDEKLVNKKICRELGKEYLPEVKSKLLTDRFCTLKLLEQVDIKDYDKYRIIIKTDIDKMNSLMSIDELKSFSKIKLSEANEVNRHHKKYKTIFKKIKDGDYDANQYITVSLVKFAFSRYYNKKPYLSGILQLLQLFILKSAVIVLSETNREFSADCLNHSLERNPSDLNIMQGEVIKKIKKDKRFQEKIKKIISKNNNKNSFEYKGKFTFMSGDLMASIHECNLVINGKRIDSGWKLRIKIKDRYDFTELVKIQDYFNHTNDKYHNFMLAIGNNIALIASSCKVVNMYDITIEFEMII